MTDLFHLRINASPQYGQDIITLCGVLIANSKNHAVMESQIAELTREVREHNGFARRMPVVEEQIKVINHRISDLEKQTERV